MMDDGFNDGSRTTMADDGNTNKDNDEREDDYDIRMPPAVNDTKMCFGVMVRDLMMALTRWGV